MDFHDRVKKVYEAHCSQGWYPDVSEDLEPVSPCSNKRACVLLCIKEDRSSGEIQILLTQRSGKVSTHKGEVCLPGGMQDKTDSSLLATALREAEEEINLKPHQVKFIGFLQKYLVFNIRRRQYDICSAVLVTLNDGERLALEPNQEVADIFWMPLKLFLGEGYHHTQRAVPFQGQFRFLHMNYFHYSHNDKVYTVWGLTAIFCIMGAMVVFQAPVHYPCTPIRVTDDENELSFKNSRGVGIARIPNGCMTSKL